MKQKKTLKARALAYLSLREYSPRELAAKLAPYQEEGDDLDGLMQWLKANGFLSEKRFVESYVRRRSVRYGSGRVLRELQRHDVDESLLRQAAATMKEDEFERALHLWQKKYGNKPDNVQEKARQIRFMLQKGFSGDVVRSVMNWKKPDESSF